MFLGESQTPKLRVGPDLQLSSDRMHFFEVWAGRSRLRLHEANRGISIASFANLTQVQCVFALCLSTNPTLSEDDGTGRTLDGQLGSPLISDVHMYASFTHPLLHTKSLQTGCGQCIPINRLSSQGTLH